MQHEDRLLAFGDLLGQMTPAVRRIARKKAVRHPLLSEDDLFQEGLSALWRVWETHCQSKPMEDLCRIGFRAVENRITSVRRRIFKQGEQLINWVDLDGSLSYTGSDGLREAVDALFVREAIKAVNVTLSDIARTVLGEVLDPGEQTIRAVRKLWTNRAKRSTPWFRIEPLVYSSALGLPLPDVRKALREIRREFVARLSPALDVGRFYQVGDNNLSLKGGKQMDQKGFAPDPADFDLPGEAPARAPAPGTKKPAAPEGGTKMSQSKGDSKKKPAPKPKTAARPASSGAKTSAKASGGGGKGKQKKVQPKPAKAGKAAGGFRAGTKREKVWKSIEAKLSKKKTVKLDDFIEAFRATGKNERSARNSASLFSWKLIERGLIRRVGQGDFALAKK